jgi:hypothetical protein
VETEPFEKEGVYQVIRPGEISFISYPYEWSFSQLKAAALTTLTIQKRALEFGMSLKDSSAYNIQFLHGKPILIDTLSFEVYQEGLPWVAYRQFCQHFLAPLALMSYIDVNLSQLLRIHIDGIPLELTSKLLPRKTRFNFSLLTHIHLHAAAQKRYAGQKVDLETPQKGMTKTGLLGILTSLESIVKKLIWQPKGTAWADYEEFHSYDDIALDHKKEIIAGYLERVNPKSVWDLGANIGTFSRLASQREIPTLAFDIDPAAVELNYQKCVKEGDSFLLPLTLDLTNPSPDLGWSHQERSSLVKRGPADCIMALALIHHLAITNNVPLNQIARFFADLGDWLIIEFVPKEDPQTQKLLASREDIFPDYTQKKFEEVFQATYKIIDSQDIKNTDRTLYLLKKDI